MPKILYTNSYNKKATAFLKKHPDLINLYAKALQLLELNPGHPSLRFHKLKGKHSDLYSVAINLSYRISMIFIMQEDIVIPLGIGTHDDLYR